MTPLIKAKKVIRTPLQIGGHLEILFILAEDDTGETVYCGIGDADWVLENGAELHRDVWRGLAWGVAQ
jgi:hypothetical protein